MAIRVYLMPIVLDEKSHRVPKYKALFQADWSMMDYGFEPVCLVGVENISAANHTAVVANGDVTALPADLTQQIGAQLTLVQNALAGLNIPENWVQSTHTYLQVLRVVALVFQFSQRLNSTLPNVRLFDTGITLATRVNQLPSNVRTALSDAATSLGFNTAGLGGNTTLRTALKNMADQFSSIEVVVGSQTL